MDFQEILTAVKKLLPSCADKSARVEPNAFSDESELVSAQLFQKWFLDKTTNNERDDLLFFVRKDGKAVEAARMDSAAIPSCGDQDYIWSETFLLNLILHEFEYHVTVAVCTVHHAITVIQRKTIKLFPAPSKQRMDKKSKESETSYPNIFFSIDNYEESFRDICIQQDGQKVAVELLALNQAVSLKKLIFSGMVDYSAVQKAFVVKEKAQSTTTSFSSRLASITPFKSRMQSFNIEQITQYIRLRGPRKSGFAELAVSKHRTDTAASLTVASQPAASLNVETVGYKRTSEPYFDPSIANPIEDNSNAVSRKISADDISKKAASADVLQLNASLTYIMLHWRTILEAVLYAESPWKISQPH